MRCVLAVAACALLAGAAGAATGPAAGSAAFLTARQDPSGGFGEQGQPTDASLTAWAALALVAANGSESARSQAGAFLRTRATEKATDGDVALRVVALTALGERVDGSLLARLREHRPGALVNETMWTVIALRAVGEEPPDTFVRAILSAQAKSGAFPWLRGGRPDSNDTAAAIQALRAAGMGTGSASIRRAVVALRAFQTRDGGFALTKGREPDAQSTAWAIQALLSAGEKPGKAPFRFLSRLRRGDGSYRYSVRYGATPVWVTAQVLPALTGKPFPLR